MAGMILTVRDRAITAWRRRLLTISPDNGYVFDVAGVHRRARLGFGDVLPEIALYFGQASYQYVTAGEDKIHTSLATQVRFAADGTDDDSIPADRGYEMFLGDIQRCLALVGPPGEQWAPILDPWYSRGEARLFPRGDRMFYAAGSPRICGVAFYELHFTQLASDPRLWASILKDGDRHVTEEMLAEVEDIAA